MRTWCLTLDLLDDPALIEQYKLHHQHVWPEILHSLRAAGILQARIWLLGARLVMTLETSDDFSFDAKAAADAANPKVQQWEKLMWNFQKPLPQAGPGEKWLLMEKIFELEPLS
ncbi:MAG TPA: L-rhamnose mutarotase [Acidobacteriaceae bacterium]|jgi:L-rhamnose mutarotase|nr:L-rhamnose mutarotase [Acidobacteriaceae bacterium]